MGPPAGPSAAPPRDAVCVGGALAVCVGGAALGDAVTVETLDTGDLIRAHVLARRGSASWVEPGRARARGPGGDRARAFQ